MRYFKMALAATAEQIEENSKVRLKDYSYDSPITAVNSFMMKRMRNGLSFLIYRVEEERIAFAGFSFDEKEDRLEEVYSYITDLLKETFGIKKIIEEPKEVTMFEYLDCLNEAIRRELSGIPHRNTSLVRLLESPLPF